MSRRTVLAAGRVAVGLLVPTALYYLLRALGAGVYVALVVSTLVSAAPRSGPWCTVAGPKPCPSTSR